MQAQWPMLCLWAEVTLVGLTKLHQQTYQESITIVGPLDFADLQVKGEAQVTGPAQGENGTFDTLSIVGPFQVKKLTAKTLSVVGPTKLNGASIAEKTAITGPLYAEDSQLGALTVQTKHAHLHNTEAASIVVEKPENPSAPQELCLSGTTVVRGNVTFQSGNGKLILKDQAKVCGQVEGIETSKAP